MNYSVILASLLITLVVTFFLSVFFGRPFRGLWLFFLLIFLATLSGQLWILPFGPVTWGISWVPLIMIAVFFSFFVLALLPPPVSKKEVANAAEGSFMILGTFLWIILIMLLISIAVGYYRMPNLLAR